MPKYKKLSPSFKIAAAALVGAAVLAGQGIHQSEAHPASITADRDANGNIICHTWDNGRLRHDGDRSGPTFGYGLIFLDCVYPNYPKSSDPKEAPRF